MYNALTVDVEDYYMVSAFSKNVSFEDWPSYESRIERNSYEILDLMDEHDVKATFFILGWVAEHHPKLIKDIYSAGHEVACHSYNHRLIYDLTPDEFREDTHKSKSILEDIIGDPVIGYRAPSYSIIKKTLWALDILIEEAFQYDSSIFPIYHDRYGFPEAERYQHTITRNGGSIIEIPPSTFQIFGHNIPIAGGGYLRFFPQWVTKKAIRRINKKEKQPVIVYIHPWEIDKQQPKIDGKLLSQFRHYVNLGSTVPKLTSFLSEFKFKPISQVFYEK